MTPVPVGVWRTLRQWASRQFGALARVLGTLTSIEPAPQVPQHLEGAVERALRPVAPSDGFREYLGANLSKAAVSRGGVSVEDARPYRRAFLLAIAVAAVVAGVVTAVAIAQATSSREEG